MDWHALKDCNTFLGIIPSRAHLLFLSDANELHLPAEAGKQYVKVRAQKKKILIREAVSITYLRRARCNEPITLNHRYTTPINFSLLLQRLITCVSQYSRPVRGVDIV